MNKHSRPAGKKAGHKMASKKATKAMQDGLGMKQRPGRQRNMAKRKK